MKRVGLLGGAFDPVHLGHLAVARAVLADLELDKVCFLPSGNHHFKDEVADFSQRKSWLEKVLADEKSFEVLDWDKGDGSVCYTADLLKRVPQKGIEYFFIIGEDNVATVKDWHCSEWLLENVQFVVVSRKGSDSWQTLDYAEKMRFVQMDFVDVCSSDIREAPKRLEAFVPAVIRDEVVSFYSVINGR